MQRLLTLASCSLIDEGDALIFRIAIGIYSLLSARLYVPEKAEVSDSASMHHVYSFERLTILMCLFS